MNNRCEFCLLETNKGPILPENMQYIPVDGLFQDIIYNGSSFFVKPDISPIVENHILVIPKEHIFCMNDLSIDKLDEFNSIKRRIIQLFQKDKKGYIFFEHGCCNEKESGSACIHHAHTHAIPVSIDTERDIVKKVLSILGTPSYDSSVVKGIPYLSIESTSMDTTLYWPDIVYRSQFFRIIISEVTGNPQRARWQNCLINDNERERSKKWLYKYKSFTL